MDAVVAAVTGVPREVQQLVQQVVEADDKVQEGAGSEVLVGLDAVALYPSIGKDIATKCCLEAARESCIETKNINLTEATLFLMLTMDQESIEESGLKKTLPRRRKTKGGRDGKRLKLTTMNSLAPTTNDQSQWEWPEKKLDEATKRKIFGKSCGKFGPNFLRNPDIQLERKVLLPSAWYANWSAGHFGHSKSSDEQV